jgi:hypothetical protein
MSRALAESKRNRALCQGPFKSQCAISAPTFDQVMYQRPGDCKGFLGGNLGFGWRNQNDLTGGRRFVERVEELASSRRVFECSGRTCLVVVPTVPPEETDTNAKHFSLCQVTAVGHNYGPPTLCQELLFSDNSTTLIAAVTGLVFHACMMGVRDFDAVFKNRGRDLTGIRSLVENVLKGKPFNLVVAEEGEDVLGTRAFLPSEVISGWREWVTVRVGIEASRKDAGITIATTILVSKQNSPDRESWTAPSDQQEASYVAALRDAFVKRGGVLTIGRGPDFQDR